MAPPIHPASFPSKRVPETLRVPSSTMMAPPIEPGPWPGRFVRLPVKSPPWIVTSDDRTTMAPPRRDEELPWNELFTNRALDPGSTLTAPPPVCVDAARLARNEHRWKRASALPRVTPPDSLTSAL